jgi:CHASE2 domain-containing sensor protein
VSGGRLHALAFALLAAFALVGLHQPLKTAITDARFLVRAETPPSQAIVVAVDGPSIEQVGTWPWPREVHAALISRLHGAGASEIAFDVDFSSLSTPSSDQALAAAFKQAGGSVILPTFRQWAIGSEGRKVQVNRPAEAFRDLTWSASVTLMLDPDGIVRRYPLGDNLDGEFTPSLGALLAGQHVSTRSSFVLDFSIPVRSVPVVSAGAILRGDPQALAAVRGKKAIVGGTAIELGDRFNIPTGRLVPGVYIHALAVETLMQGRTLHSAGAWVAWAAVFAVIALVGLAWRRRSTAGRALLVVALALSSEAAAWVLHHRLGIILDTSLVHLAAIFYLVAIGVLEIKARGLLRWAAERRFHRVAMSLGEGLACLDENGVVTVWTTRPRAFWAIAPTR